ncbi:MAG: hypothetical protein H7Y03_13255 [Chitinophagaceae bacterium]|nr:hypothetical protein [Chitinophagaceae bacterium]
MQNHLQIIAGIIGLITYCFLFFKIFKNNAKQNFAAFLLWAILSIITTITVFIEEGNYWLSLGNVLGETAITILLIVKKQIAWSWIETSTAFLVIICLIIWFFMGEKAAIVSSSLATVTASIPQMVSTYKKPSSTPTGIYVAFLMANILSLYAGKSWTIEERFYPASAVVLCLIIALFSLRILQTIGIRNTNRAD